MSYQRFKKGGRVSKSQFLEKSVQKIKRIFREKVPFLNRRLLINGSYLSIDTFHMVNVKRVVL